METYTRKSVGCVVSTKQTRFRAGCLFGLSRAVTILMRCPVMTPDLQHPVLVVEDEMFIRMIAVDALEERGFAILEASDAQEALEILERTPGIALIFTDINMLGKTDGLDLATEVAKRWPDMRSSSLRAACASSLPKSLIRENSCPSPTRLNNSSRLCGNSLPASSRNRARPRSARRSVGGYPKSRQALYPRRKREMSRRRNTGGTMGTGHLAVAGAVQCGGWRTQRPATIHDADTCLLGIDHQSLGHPVALEGDDVAGLQ